MNVRNVLQHIRNGDCTIVIGYGMCEKMMKHNKNLAFKIVGSETLWKSHQHFKL